MSDDRYRSDVCSFICDLEGNLQYLIEYCNISKVIKLEEHESGQVVPFYDGDDKKKRLEFVNKTGNTKLCFGGDSQDKGIGDIRIVLLFLDFRKRYKDRVHFIIGNRDCNKLRMATELGEAALASDEVANDKGFPYWVPADKRVTPVEALAKDGKTSPANPAADRLKWMLKHTLGSDGAFERRKWELEVMTGKEASDDDVVQSYRDEVDPSKEDDKQFMLRFLKEACLGFTYGKTLFVHGGVCDDNIGYIPGDPKEYKTLTEWIVALNKWKTQEIEDFTNHPTDGLNSTDRKGHGLMDYGTPCGGCMPRFDPEGKPRTVICTSPLEKGNAALLTDTVTDFLAKSNIFNVVVGHIPHGDCPTVIRTGEAILVMGDTSYSDMGHKTTRKVNGTDQTWVDNRGGAVSEILVWFDGRLEVHGYRKDKAAGEVENQIEYQLRYEQADKYVGRKVKDGDMKDYWVKARYKDGRYCLCLGQGFKLSYATKTEEEMAALVWDEKTEPKDPSKGVFNEFMTPVGSLAGSVGDVLASAWKDATDLTTDLTKQASDLVVKTASDVTTGVQGLVSPAGQDGEKEEEKEEEKKKAGQ
eukprot:CAMPEP_0177724738 /NCGR_PEP_ID=MMETSP0484_2-20121128/18884_1 /TAXON_ID=354590 /ORGANISM="Rhodomonas lens, Strain RHODO" /LENGTH=583 /DNA_ID=CAMNT_0019237217 /DNA_START=36 /DNA_END=1787 /DNA_ORIENTATION=+